MEKRVKRPIAILLLMALVSLAGYVVLASSGDLLAEGWLFLSVWTGLALVYLLASRLVVDMKPSLPVLAAVLLAGLAFRLAMFAGPVSLSDDIHRYVRDGAAQTRGINPYANAPADDPLPLREVAGHAQINNPSISTIYPPLAQIIFALAAWIQPSERSIRGTIIVFDLGTIALLFVWLRAAQKNPLTVILYAWHPLAIVEGAGSGHVDGAGAFFLVLSIVLIIGGRRTASSAAFAASILTKVLPVGLVPVYMRELRARHFAVAAGIGVVFFLPYLSGISSPSAGLPMSGGLSQYATRWEFNGSVFPIVLCLIESLDPTEALKVGLTAVKSFLGDPQFLLPAYGWLYPGTLARGICGVATFALIIAAARRKGSFERAVFTAISAMLLLSPTLHPWYLLWILPFFALIDSRAWMWLSFAVAVSYAASPGFGGLAPSAHPAPGFEALHASGVPLWVSAIEYLPMLILSASTICRVIRPGLGAGAFRRSRRAEGAGSSPGSVDPSKSAVIASRS